MLILAVSIYICILLGIAYFSLKKRQTATDFMLGNRGMNVWLTALAAHASDMSTWVFFGLSPTNLCKRAFSMPHCYWAYCFYVFKLDGSSKEA